MKIGFFDSGLGGLLILKAVARELPLYDYEFYGDTAHVPYGDRTEAEIYELTKSGVLHLFNRDCALVIIACNTASAETLRKLQTEILTGEHQMRRILGVIIPTVEAIIESGAHNPVLFATRRTVESGKYERELRNRKQDLFITPQAMPKLVPLIEAGDSAAAGVCLTEAVSTALAAGHDAFVLGCTHYSLLKEVVRKTVGERGVVFSQDEIIPPKLADYLARHPELTATLTRTSSRTIYLTDPSTRYDSIIKNFLGGVLISD